MIFLVNSLDTELRRSKRQRKVQFENMSWLADDQMHKMGYPNLNTPGYSEEDSRDAQEIHIEEPTRSTRHSSDVNSNKRREIKKSKYLYDYETNEVTTRKRKSELSLLRSNERNKRELRNRRESNDKENNEEPKINGRSSRRTSGPVDEDSEKKSDETEEDDSIDSSKMIKENGVENNQDDEKVVANNEENKSSESDIIPKIRTRSKPEKIIIEQNFSRRPKDRKTYGKHYSIILYCVLRVPRSVIDLKRSSLGVYRDVDLL